MNFFQFIASLVSSLIWPALVVVFVIAYRREIGGGLERLSNRVIHARSTDDVKHLFDDLRSRPDTAPSDTATAPGRFEAEFESMWALLSDAPAVTDNPAVTGSTDDAPAASSPDTPATTGDAPATAGDVSDEPADPSGEPAARPGLFERMSQVAASTEPKTAVLLAASALAGELREVNGADLPPGKAIDALKTRGAITRETALTLHELLRLGDLAEHDAPDRITTGSAARYLGIVDATTVRLRTETDSGTA